MNNNPIGILDSGVGGLSVFKQIRRELSSESVIYLADSINTPYGAKSAKTIFSLANRLVSFLIEKKVKLIVIACNVITVTSLEKLRTAYPQIPIVGTVPVVKTAASVSKNKRIGILSTTQTDKSEYQKMLVEKFASECNVVSIGTDRLVPLIEKGEVQGEKIHTVLTEVLLPFKKNKIDTLALGCTHYPFLKKEVDKILGKEVTFLDSGGAVARQVKRVLQNNQALTDKKRSTQEFYTSGDVDLFKKVAKNLLGVTITGRIQPLWITD